MDRNLIIQHLGGEGRMISPSKSAYMDKNPDNLVVFNSNVFAKQSALLGLVVEYEKIWYGDMDLTKDMDMLVGLAADAGCELFVLREMDGRFEHEEKPNIANYVFLTDGKTKEYGPGAKFWLMEQQSKNN